MRDSSDASRASVASFNAFCRCSSDDSNLQRQYSYTINTLPADTDMKAANSRFTTYVRQKLPGCATPIAVKRAKASSVPKHTASPIEPIRPIHRTGAGRHSSLGQTRYPAAEHSPLIQTVYTKEANRPAELNPRP